MLDLFDILSGSQGGQAYVPVNADDSLNNAGLLNANGSFGSATPSGLIVHWSRSNGVTNFYGWQFDNKSVDPTGKTEEEINEAIAEAIWEMEKHPREWAATRAGCVEHK